MNQFSTPTPDARRQATALLLIRIAVGLVFVGEGALKFIRPDMLGPGRFAKIGLPAPELLAYGDGILEIVCGFAILVGLLTRLAAMPMVGDMAGAIVLTKIPLLWGSAALFPTEGGFLDFFHESRLDFSMLLASLALVLVGAGAKSVDAHRGIGQLQGAGV
jgi:putative oxidoreductase